jgi:hypothetical protein
MMTDKEFVEFTDKTVKDFKGDFGDLYSAIGFITVGRYVGWRVLKITVSPLTYRKYKKILGVDCMDELRSEGVYAHKSVGLALANKASDFWAVVTGNSKEKISLADKRMMN